MIILYFNFHTFFFFLLSCIPCCSAVMSDTVETVVPSFAENVTTAVPSIPPPLESGAFLLFYYNYLNKYNIFNFFRPQDGY